MTTIDNIMALHNAASHAAVQYALLAQVSLRSERSMQALEDRNEANEALRAALAQQAEQGWRDIETAPTDGTTFLGRHGNRVREAYRVQRNDCEMWCFGGSSGAVEFAPYLKPTHWMPLPTPPKE